MVNYRKKNSKTSNKSAKKPAKSKATTNAAALPSDKPVASYRIIMSKKDDFLKCVRALCLLDPNRVKQGRALNKFEAVSTEFLRYEKNIRLHIKRLGINTVKIDGELTCEIKAETMTGIFDLIYLFPDQDYLDIVRSICNCFANISVHTMRLLLALNSRVAALCDEIETVRWNTVLKLLWFNKLCAFSIAGDNTKLYVSLFYMLSKHIADFIERKKVVDEEVIEEEKIDLLPNVREKYEAVDKALRDADEDHSDTLSKILPDLDAYSPADFAEAIRIYGA